MAKKVVVTEVVTAEMLNSDEHTASGLGPEDSPLEGTSGAAAGAMADTQAVGVAAGMAMGAGYLSVFLSAAHAANGAALAQGNANILLEATTVQGVLAILCAPALCRDC